MGGKCPHGHHWDALIKTCMSCHLVCQQKHAPSKCTSYCESAQCKTLPGHHYDRLLQTCVSCTKICGRHPAECAPHCETPQTPVKTIKPTALTDLEGSTIVLYSLLALCAVLLVSSLSIAFTVFLRKCRAKPSNLGAKEANPKQKREVQPGKESGLPGGQLWQSSTDLTSSSRPIDRETDDPSPTETCVCVHCFPDLKATGLSNDRPLRAPTAYYQQTVLHRAQTQNGGAVWTGGPGGSSNGMGTTHTLSA
uniref:TNFR-Cys domain-containing protein n=1 Tax=Monopterus albus TaxID=43700 RepID=A0A3Q3IQU0_MONAL|nr:tumor necrosis factor receptor superfamily member 13B [Monopterus albus]XP_020477692.1 tumor necrosis factor receptor superfamily member 13B [Monopterus albus]